ncbi:MAG TPA: hypothetical protein VHE57_16405 [Mycobacteriales bacterium]|nr:hypothetical protein [Mycobacteriales bacterium]
MHPELRASFGRTAARVSVAEEMPVGARLHRELEVLSSMPMDAATAVRLHALWGKVIAHAQARQMVATLDTVNCLREGWQPHSSQEADMLAAQEHACATHVAYPTARAHLALVRRIDETLHQSWEALDRGEVSLQHVKAVDRATEHCPARVAAAVDACVVPGAIERGWTPAETGKAARKLVLELDPAGAAEREAAARSASDVEFYPQPDGAATLSATGDAPLAREMFDAVNDTAAAMARAGDDRSLGVRRFHALVDLVLGRSGQATAPRNQREMLAIGQISTLIGLDDQPGELIGYGPISADQLRRISADHRLRRLLTDPLTGEVKDLGRRSYAPSARLRQAAQAIYRTCTAPGCGMPAIRCEIDHRREFNRGGCTDQCNLKPLCKLHHELKTKKLWKVDHNPDGSETWTSYLGFTYTRRPPHFPLPDPPPIDDEPPLDIADRLPDAADPDPPRADEPLPEPPRLTEEQYEEMEEALDYLDLFDISFREWCDKHYDEARATGLVA